MKRRLLLINQIESNQIKSTNHIVRSFHSSIHPFIHSFIHLPIKIVSKFFEQVRRRRGAPWVARRAEFHSTGGGGGAGGRGAPLPAAPLGGLPRAAAAARHGDGRPRHQARPRARCRG